MKPEQAQMTDVHLVTEFIHRVLLSWLSAGDAGGKTLASFEVLVVSRRQGGRGCCGPWL